MKLGIIINTSDPETVWNALRLGATAMDEGHHVTMFLLGAGVEIEGIEDQKFDVAGLLQKFKTRRVMPLGCSTCMELRHREPGMIVKSHLSDLVEIIASSDKVVTFG